MTGATHGPVADVSTGGLTGSAESPTDFALIIGAMKCGTTSLFEILSQHPEIAPARVKEPGFFSDPQVWQNGWAWYLRLWNWDPDRHRVALEASPAYTTSPARPGVPERMASVKGVNFRLIYLMRNPLDQIPSNVRHALYAGWGHTLDEGIPEWMVETVRYSMQIDQFLAVFPREQLLLLTLEEFSQQPDEVLRRVCEFLDIDTGFSFQRVGARYNSGDAYEGSRLWISLVKCAPLRKMVNRILPRSFRHWVRSTLPRLGGEATVLGRFQLTEAEQAALTSQLAPDLRRLETVFGVEVRRYWFLDFPD